MRVLSLSAILFFLTTTGAFGARGITQWRAERAAHRFVSDRYELKDDFLVGCRPWGHALTSSEEYVGRFRKWTCEWAGHDVASGLTCDGVFVVRESPLGTSEHVVRGSHCKER
jgi:hypothetical protein